MKGEILAPCGDFACMEAAVRSGADAVYFGAGNFNARRNAGNFDGEALGKAIEYCRVRGVKTHITLNTLLQDGETDEALLVAREAAAAGADALIVQDLGLARRLRQVVPDLALHASTQLSIHDENGVRAAKRLGFSRVVLARELSLEEIRKICHSAAELGMEIEAFIHGALCMSVSGQCYLSAMIGGRSGNRGRCAQPCRLPFSAGGDSGYALSLKDMSHLSQIGALADAGVVSFKIEGRMKPPEYVAAAVTAAREARDAGRVSEKTGRLLESVFSRSGFTDGYLSGKRRDMFGIRTEADKTMAAAVENSLHELYRKEFPRLGLTASLICRVGQTALFTVSDGTFSAVAEGMSVSRSAGQPLDRAFAERQLSRTGGTPFFLQSLTLDCDEDAFLPASELNRLRRSALESLLQKRRARPAVRFGCEPSSLQTRTHTLSGLTARFSGVLPASLNGITRAYLPYNAPDELFLRLIREIGNVGAELPRTLFAGDAALRKRLNELRELGVSRALCENVGAVELAWELGFQADGGMFLQITNSYALAAAADLGLASAVISFENTLEQTAGLRTDMETGLTVYGYLPLMLVRCCPLKNSRGCQNCRGDFITDRMGKRFFVKCRDGASEILNCVPLVMSDRKREIKNVDFTLLYFTRETAQEIGAVISDWTNGAAPSGEHTRGLYYRGVR